MQRVLRLLIGFACIVSLIVMMGVLGTLEAADPANYPILTGTPQYFPIIFKNYPDPGLPTFTPTVTRSPFNYTLQPGSPAYVSNFANNNGCNWFGMSGQVFDLMGKGVPGLFVHVEGPNNQTFDSPTGAFPKYGVSGWEVSLGNAPVATTNSYFVQLRNGWGQPLSDNYMIPTYASCTQNHIIISFVQNH